MSKPSRLEAVLDQYASVFAEGLPIQAVPETARPKFCKPRTVPFALRDAVEADLDRLEK